MFDLQKRLDLLRTEFQTSWEKLKLDEKMAKMAALEEEVAVPEIWNNLEYARQKTTELANLHEELDPWRLLQTQIADISELMELGDESLLEEFSGQLDAMESSLNNMKIALRFTGKYDHNDAIMRITAGAGGTEAMDWSGMLERMYLRWAERHKVKVQILDRVAGEEAGIKTVSRRLTRSLLVLGEISLSLPNRKPSTRITAMVPRRE